MKSINKETKLSDAMGLHNKGDTKKDPTHGNYKNNNDEKIMEIRIESNLIESNLMESN